MQPQAFLGQQVEIMLLHVGEDLRRERHFATGEDVFFHPAVGATFGLPGDGVQQHQPFGLQAAGHALEKAGRLLVADVFEHADADHLVEFRLRFEVEPVLQADFDPVGQPGGGHPLTCQCRLFLRQRDAHAAHAVLPGGTDQQSAPAAADVQQAFVRCQCELDQRVVDLGLLGFRQRHVRPGKVGTRVAHAVVEPEPVEVVAKVIMVSNVGLLLLFQAHAVERAHDAGYARQWPVQQLAVTVKHVQQGIPVTADVQSAMHVGLSQSQDRVLAAKVRFLREMQDE